MIKIDKNIIVLSVGRLLQALLAIFTLRLLTEVLPQDQVGQQYVINSMILWFSMVLINPVGMYVNRHLHEWKKENALVYYMKKLNSYFLIIAVLSLVIVFLCSYFSVFKNITMDLSMYFYFLAFIYLSTWFQTITSMFNLFNQQKIFIILSILSQFLGLLFAFLLTHFFKVESLYWLFGLLSGQVVSLIVAIIFFKKHFYSDQRLIPARDSFFQKTTFLFCYPVAITTLFMWFNTQGYRLYLESEIGLASLGALGVGLGLAASVSSVVESITTQFLFPRYYESLVRSSVSDRVQSWNELWLKSLCIYVPFCFLTVSASTFLVRVLTAKQFHHIASLVCLGAFVELFRQLSNILYLVAHGEKKTQQTIVPYLTGALACILGFLIIQKWFSISPFSVGIVLIVSGVFIFSFNILNAYRMIPINLNLKFIFKTLLFSTPILSVFFLSSDESSTLNLFLSLSLVGIYLLAVTAFLQKTLI